MLISFKTNAMYIFSLGDVIQYYFKENVIISQ